ncbi:tautomerase family protein [Nevskia sp.]|uniref:tautomerase family protein n=1 Tax=Nevskia sp. TaxID=1929292 RepID=UPI0025D86B01|nr:tautomerase family protein [Nevskia sp.]
MPVCNVIVLKGHPRATLKQLVVECSNTLARIIGAPKDRLEVWVTEVEPALWGLDGRPGDEVLQTVARSEIEMPFIRMVLLQGRPVEQHHQLIAEMTAVVAKVLGANAERIRLQIDEVHPDRWGIGGVPASVRRATEIAARAATA